MSKMNVENGNLNISVDGTDRTFDQNFVASAIHDKLYGMAYRKTRNV